MIRKLWHLVCRTPVERAEDAITRAANQSAEARREEIKMDFYACLLQDIDPQVDWHLFARIKQKEHDAKQSHAVLQARASQASIRAEERIEAAFTRESSNESHTVVADRVDAGPIRGAVAGSRHVSGTRLRIAE